MIFLFFLFITSAHAQRLEFVDATGFRWMQQSEKSAPMRIVTLAPSLAELVAELVDMDRIVAVSEFTDFPPKLKQKPSVGPYPKVNVEAILQLKPDLVLATQDGNDELQVRRLRDLGLSVVVVRTESYRQILESIRWVGIAVGAMSRAEQVIERIDGGVRALQSRVKSRPGSAPRVLLQLSADPLIVVGKNSFLNEALTLVGAVNVYGDINLRYPRPALEDLLKRQPDAIIILSLGEDVQTFKAMRAQWNRYSTLSAVKNKRVLILEADGLVRPGSRFVEGLALLERALSGVSRSAP